MCLVLHECFNVGCIHGNTNASIKIRSGLFFFWCSVVLEVVPIVVFWRTVQSSCVGCDYYYPVVVVVVVVALWLLWEPFPWTAVGCRMMILA